MNHEIKNQGKVQKNVAVFPMRGWEIPEQDLGDDQKKQNLQEMRERRKCLRIPAATLAHVNSEGHHVTEDVFIRDISVEGIGGYSKLPYKKGEILHIKLKLSLSEEDVIEETLAGEIRWSTQVDQGKRYAFGLRFTEIKEQNPVVFDYLKALEARYLHA